MNTETSLAPVWNRVHAGRELLELKDPDGWWLAEVRWDGRVHMARAAIDQPGADYDILDLEDMIVRLTAIRDEARKHFGVTWTSADVDPSPNLILEGDDLKRCVSRSLPTPGPL